MTPRKELFIKIKDRLKTIPNLEYIDLYRGQFEGHPDSYPGVYTAVLIQINAINYEAMTQGVQEGKASVDVIFYCKDGFADQFQNTADAEHGLIEIDLLDTIAENLVSLQGDYFRPLELSQEKPNTAGYLMSYTLTFTTTIYRQLGQSTSTSLKTVSLKLI